MNAFRARLQHKINSYYLSKRAEKVGWFKIVVKLKPEEYKMQYKNCHLFLLKLVLPASSRYGWDDLWEVIDSTMPEDLYKLDKLFV